MALNPDAELLVADWFNRARESQRAHYACCARFRRFTYLLGIPTIILTTVVGMAILASVANDKVTDQMKIAIGLVSLAAAVLATLLTFLGFSQRIDRHRLAGAGYGAIGRSLEFLKTFSPADPSELKRTVAEIQKQLDDLAESSPEVPVRLKRKIGEEFKSNGHRHIFDSPVEADDKKPAPAT
jgi:hypothetical protein